MRWKVILLTLAWPAAAAATPYILLGYGAGGTSLARNIQAGEGFLLSGGIVLPVTDTIQHRFEAQLGAGILFSHENERNDKLYWQRIPLEAFYYYRNTQENFRAGWGLVYHMRGELSGKGKHRNIYAQVDNALGFAVSAEKIIHFKEGGEPLAVGLRYQWINYESPQFLEKANGDAFMITVGSSH